jgi:hypothetical protein
MSELKQVPLDFATKDYDGFMEMFKELIPVLTPEWTDLSDNDPGIVILQLLAYAMHIQSFSIDKGVTENIISIAKTKRAVLLLSKFLGYEIKSQTPAIVDVTFYKTEDNLTKEIVIPPNTKITTDPELGEVITFETDIPLTILAEEAYGTVSATQGESVFQDELGLGNGEPNQVFTISQLEVLKESISLQTIEAGTVYSWNLVDNFIESLPLDRHFMMELTEDGETLIIFSDGVTGMRPSFNSLIEVSFRYGGGLKGNLAISKINQLFNSISGIDRVENLVASTGGTDFEDIEKVKTLAPKNYRTGGSAVTVEDFQDLAETFSGISRAVCIETFNVTNDVYLYLATEDGIPLTDTLKNAVKESIEEVMVMNQNLYVFEVAYHDYDVTITAYLYDNFGQANADTEIRGLLTSELNPSKFSFGETVYLSQIVNTAFGARGVRNIVINTPTSDIAPSTTELPRLVNLTVNIVGGVA